MVLKWVWVMCLCNVFGDGFGNEFWVMDLVNGFG